ncbi:MAG: hypothetical protein V7637_2847 [Mycobacteriales bacterium]|jgi:hypothetical protein
MRLRKTLVAVTAAGLAVTFGASAYASDKADAGKAAAVKGSTAADAGRPAKAVGAALQASSAAVQSRIAGWVAGHGTKYTWGSYADAVTGRVVVSTDAPDSVVASLVGGTANVEVRKAHIDDLFSRKSDVAPYWGGAGIVLTQGVPQCSAGYVVQDGAGTRSMVTAGHCFSNGQTALTENGGLVVGTVSGNGLPSQDMELIGGQSYGSSIYTGGVDDSTAAHVLSAADPVVGFTNYCHSGRTTGNNCGHTANSVTAMVCTSSGCKSPVTAFTGGVSPAGGDSGSPFYVDSVSAPDKHIRGHIIAGDGVTTYAELWSRVQARFGVSIVT